MGCRPRARSVLRCYGVLALRQGPGTPAWTEAVQNESQLQEASKVAVGQLQEASKVAVGSAETQVKSRFGASF